MLTELLDRAFRRLSGTANPDQWLIDWINRGEPSASGEWINEENAMRVPAVAAAVNVLAESIQTLPVEICMTTKDGRNVPAADHEVTALLTREPNEEVSAPVWKNTEQRHVALWGNCYSTIQRLGRGTPYALWQRSPKPERTKPVRSKKDGRLYYQLRDESGREEDLVPAADVFHVPYISDDGLIGRSPVKLFKEAIGGNKAAERFANEVFKNHGATSGFLEHPSKLSEPAYQRLKSSMAEDAEHGHRHGTKILEEGMKYNPATWTLADTQMVDVRRFLIEEVARIWRITPHLLQDLSHGTFSNITELGRQFIVYTCAPWMNLWCGEINRKLLRPPFWSRFNARMFLKGDPAALSAWYRTMFMIGYYSLNEIRHEEGENPIEDPNADEHFVPLNMVPLSKANDPAWRSPGKPAGGSPEKPGAVPPGDGKTPAEEGVDRGQLTVDSGQSAAGSEKPVSLTIVNMPPQPDVVVTPPSVEVAPAEITVSAPVTVQAPDFTGVLAGIQEELQSLRAERSSRAVRAAETLLESTLRRMERIEAREAMRAANDPKNFLTRMEDFYRKHAETWLEALESPLGLLEALGRYPVYEVTDDAGNTSRQGPCGRLRPSFRSHRQALLAAAECKPSELPERVAKAVENWGNP